MKGFGFAPRHLRAGVAVLRLLRLRLREGLRQRLRLRLRARLLQVLGRLLLQVLPRALRLLLLMLHLVRVRVLGFRV